MVQSRHIEYSTQKGMFVGIKEDKTNFVSKLHFHSVYEIYLTHSGPMSCLINNKIYPLMPNDMLIFAPSDIHMGTKPIGKKYESTVFCFTPDRIKNLGGKINLLMPFGASANNFSHKISLSEKQADEYINMLQEVKKLQKSDDEYGDIRQQLLLVHILIFINKLYKKNINSKKDHIMLDDDLAFKILLFITDNISRDLSLDSLSKEFFISKNILNKHFRDSTGYTLGSYIRNYRMYCARQLLESGDDVRDTAWKVGYQNTSNFIRSYKSIIGETPGKSKE